MLKNIITEKTDNNINVKKIGIRTKNRLNKRKNHWIKILINYSIKLVMDFQEFIYTRKLNFRDKFQNRS